MSLGTSILDCMPRTVPLPEDESGDDALLLLPDVVLALNISAIEVEAAVAVATDILSTSTFDMDCKLDVAVAVASSSVAVLIRPPAPPVSEESTAKGFIDGWVVVFISCRLGLGLLVCL